MPMTKEEAQKLIDRTQDAGRRQELLRKMATSTLDDCRQKGLTFAEVKRFCGLVETWASGCAIGVNREN